ncbi:MAG: orotidine-5'-phosphate decarboxylase [Candidatus Aquicultorales bacterium]
MEAQDMLIIALDYSDPGEALELVDALGDSVSFYKVGLELYVSAGDKIVRSLKGRGKKVFLDLKLHDIPTQVANACKAAVRLGADMLTVHSLGGPEMLRAAAKAVGDESSRLGTPGTLLVAVTVLTSFDEEAMSSVGLRGPVDEAVSRLASLAKEAGAGGVVCSPREVRTVRRTVDNEGFAIVTPGIRRSSDPPNEQKRTLTPAEAVSLGATHLVVGRPVTRAADPREAALAFSAEISKFLS